jgi:hypothetical protein
VASGDWSFVGGGIKHSNAGIGSFIGGGGTNGSNTFGNSITSNGSVSAIVGGWNNSISNTFSFIGGGASNNATSSYCTIAGGTNHTASGYMSTIVGANQGTTRGISGNTVFPASVTPITNSSGVSQAAMLVLGVQTTDATATVLRSDTGAAGSTNQVILPNNSAYYFRGEVVAGVTGGGNTKGWYVEGVIKRGAGVGTTAIVGTATVTSLYADAGAATWALTATADTTNGGLAITFTGQASTTIRCVCQLRTTEMTF